MVSVVFVDCGMVVVVIMVVMVGSVADYGGCFGCWWWFKFWLVVVAELG